MMQVPDVDFVVALLINGDRMLERQLKKRKKTKEICPICRGDAHIAKYGPTGKFFVRFYPHRRAWYASRFSLNGTDVTTASTD